nr:CoA pyrophosphatase [Clostridia bacterium]
AIHTVFGQIREEALSRIQASKAEVAEWFTIPVDWLAQNEPFVYEYRVLPEIRSDFPYDAVQSPDKYNWRAGTCTVPIWHYEGHCLWGMTARMVVAILKFLA